MNIFHVNSDPKLAARDLCDKHVVKMILESAQMICSFFPKDTAPYKRTHYNHPSTVWARTSESNFLWLTEHSLELGEEYTRRYQKQHKSIDIIKWCLENYDTYSSDFINEDKSLTEFAQCMPDVYKVPGNAVQAYRNYYIVDKKEFATWKKPGKKPEWFFSS